jgi:hypothetical protein
MKTSPWSSGVGKYQERVNGALTISRKGGYNAALVSLRRVELVSTIMLMVGIRDDSTRKPQGRGVVAARASVRRLVEGRARRDSFVCYWKSSDR